MKINLKIAIVAVIATTTLVIPSYASELNEYKTLIYLSDDGGTTKYDDVASLNVNGSTYCELKDICKILGIEVNLDLTGLESIIADNYIYYKIRDLAEIENFSCIWDERTSTIRLDNRYSYSDDNKLGEAKKDGQFAIKESVVNGYMDLSDGDNVCHYPVSNADITYFADSKDYYEIAQYIKANIDNDFNLNNYWVNEICDNPSGLNELYFSYKVMDVPSNYYYSVKIVNNSVFLINKVGKINNDIYTVDLVKPDITDDELKALAIDSDGFADKYSVEEQRISKRFIMNSMEFKYEVETVYKDENGCFFCTLYTYEP